jgi:transcriptional regulator with XRE-family HTH domain
MASLIHDLREQQGISIGALARRTGLARMTVQAADRGEPVSLETTVKIARVLGVTVADIDPVAALLLEGVA